jgi:O-6-methylguanine DNA methyltransferase
MIDEFAFLDVMVFDSPIGTLLAGASTEGVRLVVFLGEARPVETELRTIVKTCCPGFEARMCEHSLLLEEVQACILAYLNEAAPLPYFSLDLRDGTPFQRKVWEALVRIPWGTTRTYREIAEQIGHPRASRAVGQACAHNPLPLLVPCHRVTAGSGRLGGFSGGLHVKKALLELEKTGRFPVTMDKNGQA